MVGVVDCSCACGGEGVFVPSVAYGVADAEGSLGAEVASCSGAASVVASAEDGVVDVFGLCGGAQMPLVDAHAQGFAAGVFSDASGG